MTDTITIRDLDPDGRRLGIHMSTVYARGLAAFIARMADDHPDGVPGHVTRIADAIMGHVESPAPPDDDLADGLAAVGVEPPAAETPDDAGGWATPDDWALVARLDLEQFGASGHLWARKGWNGPVRTLDQWRRWEQHRDGWLTPEKHDPARPPVRLRPEPTPAGSILLEVDDDWLRRLGDDAGSLLGRDDVYGLDHLRPLLELARARFLRADWEHDRDRWVEQLSIALFGRGTTEAVPSTRAALQAAYAEAVPPPK